VLLNPPLPLGERGGQAELLPENGDLRGLFLVLIQILFCPYKINMPSESRKIASI
jgi:hypothetical protein